MENEYDQKNYGYGKRPLWQWIVLYAVIGGVLYGLAYYFFFANKGGYEYGTGTTDNYQTQTQPVPQNNNAPVSGQTQSATEPQQHAPAQTTGGQTPPAPSSATHAPQSFTVNGNDTSADLTTIKVSKGTPVTITFGADADGTYHGGLDFRSSVINTGTIAPGGTKTIRFTATQSFSFTPYWPATNIAKPYQIKVVVQ